MKVLWLINAPIPALCERAGLPVQVKEGWIEGLYNSLMALVREKKQDFELAMAFPQFSRSETIEGELDGNSFYGFYKEEDKPYKYNKRLEERLKYIIEKADPDVVHIAGTEYEHAAAMVRVFNKPEKTVVSIQGLTSVYARHYMADLPINVRYGFTFRDLVKLDNLYFDRKKYYDVLKRYNIPLNRQLSKLSRGNIMVVQMAFAFSYKSEVLFLDEPSAHLDSYAREELYELIGEYQDEGHIIFWSSHLMEELDKRADYVLAIKKGQQAYFGTKEELTERYHVVKGNRRQLDYMSKVMVGRRDEENFSMGLIDASEDYLKLASVDEPAGLGDIVEYLL